MTVFSFSNVFASDFAATILVISAAPLILGLAAFAVAMGRHADVALGGALGPRGDSHAGRPGIPRPANRWRRHPARLFGRSRRGSRGRGGNDAPCASPAAAEVPSPL